MTAKDLNRDAKRFVKKVKKNWESNYTSEADEKEFKEEFMRLYLADPKAEYFNRNMLAAMIRINIRYRFVSLHNFFIGISL